MTDKRILKVLLDAIKSKPDDHHHNIAINGERYTLIDRRAQWRKKFDSVSDKS